MAPSTLSLFYAITILITAKGSYLPSYVTPCKIRVPEFRECAINSVNTGLPILVNGDKKLGIPTFNPLFIPFIEFSSGDFTLNATDINIFGLENVKMTDIKADLEKNSITIELVGREMQLDLNYNIGGKIASLLLEGHGKGKIVCYDPLVSYNFVFDVYEKNGHKHAQIKSDNLEIRPSKVFFQLDNLFNGNKALGDNTNKLLNENWQELMTEFKPAMNEIIGSVIRGIFNPLAKKVPINELITDY